MTNRKDLSRKLLESFQGIYKVMLQRPPSAISTIPFGQKAALISVAIHKTISVKQLAAALHVTSGAATQHIEALVQAGLVIRNPDPNDRRTVRIKLSGKGMELIKKLERERLTLMETISSDISDEELEIFVRTAGKINDKLTKIGEKKHV